MRIVIWPELLRMPEKAAGREFLRAANRVHLRWLRAAAAALAAMVVMVQAIEGACATPRPAACS